MWENTPICLICKLICQGYASRKNQIFITKLSIFHCNLVIFMDWSWVENSILTRFCCITTNDLQISTNRSLLWTMFRKIFCWKCVKMKKYCNNANQRCIFYTIRCFIIDENTTKYYNLPVDNAKITKRIYVAIMFHKYCKIRCHYKLQIWRSSYLMS